MNKKSLQKFKQLLEKDKDIIEKELGKFAKKDEKLKGDWDTRFPFFGEETGGAGSEKKANEIEEYATLLPIEYTLEIRLRDINLALEKIKKNKYGICENCKKEISKQRLKVYPEARTCKKCNK
jgi:DnaK suppressor protein